MSAASHIAVIHPPDGDFCAIAALAPILSGWILCSHLRWMVISPGKMGYFVHLNMLT